MSLLSTVRTGLQSNTNIQIVSVREANHFPDPREYWSHIVSFYVAPTTGIYEIRELMEFMNLLIPGLPPTSIDPFEESKTSLTFGKLYFDEKIGEESVIRKITISDPDFPLPDAVAGGGAILQENRDLFRRIFVQLYPNMQIARAAADGQLTFSISKEALRSHKKTGWRHTFKLNR